MSDKSKVGFRIVTFVCAGAVSLICLFEYDPKLLGWFIGWRMAAGAIQAQLDDEKEKPHQKKGD
jgi:hypothetical protein